MRNILTFTTTTSRLSSFFWVVILMVTASSCRLCRAAFATTTRSRSALALCSTSTSTPANEVNLQHRQSRATDSLWASSSRIFHALNAFSSREVLSLRNRHGIRLFSSRNDDDDYDDDNSSSSSGTTTSFNNNRKDWVVPKFIEIPADQLEMSFVRSSGSGGQNVNKVNSQVQVRLHLETAHWIPYEVRQRLSQREAGRINKEGVLTLHVQEHRTQVQNRKTAMHKLQEMILQAWPRPKERNLRTGLSNGTKKRRKEDKRKRGEVKKNRGPVGFD